MGVYIHAHTSIISFRPKSRSVARAKRTKERYLCARGGDRPLRHITADLQRRYESVELVIGEGPTRRRFPLSRRPRAGTEDSSASLSFFVSASRRITRLPERRGERERENWSFDSCGVCNIHSRDWRFRRSGVGERICVYTYIRTHPFLCSFSHARSRVPPLGLISLRHEMYTNSRQVPLFSRIVMLHCYVYTRGKAHKLFLAVSYGGVYVCITHT